jgi:hypothetical protein
VVCEDIGLKIKIPVFRNPFTAASVVAEVAKAFPNNAET